MKKYIEKVFFKVYKLKMKFRKKINLVLDKNIIILKIL